MPSRTLAVVALALLLGCSDTDVDHSLVVEIPATVAAIPAGTLHVVLFRYHPLLMDGPATRVDHMRIPFSHRADRATFVRARVQGRGVQGERFYIAVDGCAVTAEGMRSILMDGQQLALPAYVRMRPREVHLAPCITEEGDWTTTP